MLTALKGVPLLFLLAISSAGVLPNDGPKTSSRTSSIAQIIFLFSPLRSARSVLSY